MPPINRLTAVQCKNFQPKEKPYKCADGHGLYLLVTPKGAKYWRQRYRYRGVGKELAHGVYPAVSLQEARQARDKALGTLKDGKDPLIARKSEKLGRAADGEPTFERIGRRWHEVNSTRWKPRHARTVMSRLELDIFPRIGDMPINTIPTTSLYSVLREIEERGALDVVRRNLQYLRHIYDHAISMGVTENNKARLISTSAFNSNPQKNRAAIDKDDLPEFLKKIDSVQHAFAPEVILAVRLMMLTFVRTAELIRAEWSEIDFQNALWIVPEARTKGKSPEHHVPLSTQSLEILRKLHKLSGHQNWVFPSRLKPKKPISTNAILSVLYHMEYKGKMTGHGFRALAMTILLEDIGRPLPEIDQQLGHKTKSPNGEAYDRAKYLHARKEMMQLWADYIDSVKL
ncbi:MAG: integrase arm-type DNA-binding domain-containing protein [Alphaproteobacteria bacterium]|nr:integrase arm-type DNA-binding domain-containing protein [Alphaproteobacteria bacterium]